QSPREDVLRHADASVCSPVVHDPSHHPPPTLRQLSAPPHTVSISFSSAYPSTCCAPNCRSKPIAHRVRRKHQRLPPSSLSKTPRNDFLFQPRVSCRGVSDQG